jgi:hypothetical protein
VKEIDERLFANKIRQALNHGAGELDPGVQEKLFSIRQQALGVYRPSAGGLSLANVGHTAGDALFHHARTIAAIMALVVGAAGTYYWNNFQQADENEEIDSALLADDLPINAYLDQGFHVWLEHSAPSSPQL